MSLKIQSSLDLIHGCPERTFKNVLYLSNCSIKGYHHLNVTRVKRTHTSTTRSLSKAAIFVAHSLKDNNTTLPAGKLLLSRKILNVATTVVFYRAVHYHRT
jgi:hypothetical protein